VWGGRLPCAGYGRWGSRGALKGSRIKGRRWQVCQWAMEAEGGRRSSVWATAWVWWEWLDLPSAHLSSHMTLLPNSNTTITLGTCRRNSRYPLLFYLHQGRGGLDTPKSANKHGHLNSHSRTVTAETVSRTTPSYLTLQYPIHFHQV
jgi:hypothetical protein